MFVETLESGTLQTPLPSVFKSSANIHASQNQYFDPPFGAARHERPLPITKKKAGKGSRQQILRVIPAYSFLMFRDPCSVPTAGFSVFLTTSGIHNSRLPRHTHRMQIGFQATSIPQN